MSELARFFRQHAGELGEQALEHLMLTLSALALAVFVGLPLGLWLARRKTASRVVLGIAAVIQTIPSLALLGFLIPFTGIGPVPAIIALFAYALLPIVTNTVTGVRGVDPAVTEAAVGMGMTNLDVLRKVELPLALPVIFAGVRTATAVNVGVATLAALVGAGGLGVYIFRGISLADPTMILAGAIPAAALALTLDAGLGAIERNIGSSFRPVVVVVAALVALVVGGRSLLTFSSPSLRLAMPGEFLARVDGYAGLAGTYELHTRVLEMDHGLMYQALARGDVEAVVGYSTDGEIASNGFRLLADDRHYFPPYYVAPVVRRATLERHPELAAALDRLRNRLDDGSMSALNARVEHGHESAGDVARSFLVGVGFSVVPHRVSPHADVVIASKTFAEQYLLAEMLGDLVEAYTPLTVELKLGLGGTKICFEALRKGEVDVYPEYTGTGLFAILGAPAARARDASAVYDYVRREFDARFGLEWLAPLGFQNTYAVIVSPRIAATKSIHTVSEFALLGR